MFIMLYRHGCHRNNVPPSKCVIRAPMLSMVMQPVTSSLVIFVTSGRMWPYHVSDFPGRCSWISADIVAVPRSHTEVDRSQRFFKASKLISNILRGCFQIALFEETKCRSESECFYKWSSPRGPLNSLRRRGCRVQQKHLAQPAQ